MMSFRRPRSRSRKTSINVLNTEKWRQYSKRISRRGTEHSEDDSEDEAPKAKGIKDWIEEFFTEKSNSTEKCDQDNEVQLTRKQTLILSTLVPDEILQMAKFDCTEPKRFVGVLLMADVSGYTALSERYSNTGKGGTYKLTATLNTYLGSLIELIYGHGGDILKFAGDAFLALWKTDNRTFLCHTIHTVIACALIIQHSFSSYETDVKVNLRVKLAISAGNLIFAPIGTGIDMNYVVTGLPVNEAKLAESVCASGEVKVTPNAWGHCYSRNYDHLVHDDGHVTIKAILYDPHEMDVTKPFLGFGGMIRQIKKPFSAIEALPDFLWDTSKVVSAADVLRKNDSLGLRKTILLAEEKNIGSEIRKFMIRPVLTQIDAHQPLEYLTEMRQVSILFITLKPRECPFLQLITIVNNSYQITCEIVYKSMGCVNKIILFDKDVMMLVVFGLRGFKHESEAQAALKCAYSIKKSLSALDGVIQVSIGVTTGQVYCGVVGHPLRREFTVIGSIVNKAARLMCVFRNKITCDESTFVKSKMSTNGFTLQPKTELKGIGKSGKIYEYTEEIRVKELYEIPMVPALLNRQDEMEYYETWLTDSNLPYRDFDALLLVGESRIGKSRLLEWMARFARNMGYRVCYLSLTSIHSATAYLALSQIMNQILGLEEPIAGFTKEEKIVELLTAYNEDLCYLNNILKVRFAYHEGIYSQDIEKRKEKAKLIFTKLMSSILETHVIFLDDLHNLDSSSWEFISLMFNVTKVFTVLAVSRGKFSSVHSWLYSVFINGKIRKIVLGPLNSEWIAPLACQILDVAAVPTDLCDALKRKCNGMPGLVESFIIHLFSSGALELKKIKEEDKDSWKDEDLQYPEKALLHPQALNVSDQARLDELIKNDATDEIGICIITNKEELNTNINTQNLDALIMIQIDSLTPYQQLLLKIASVIGTVLSRELLENIMYENQWLTTAKAIKRLFSMHVLTCANAESSKWSRRSISTASDESHSLVRNNITCECKFDYNPEDYENLPKYAFCKVMKFRSRNSQKTCYELLPLNQKKEFHSRIVHYLDNNKQKCPDCGGTFMIVQSFTNLQQPEPCNTYINSSTSKDSTNSESEAIDNTDLGQSSHNSHESINQFLQNRSKSEASSTMHKINTDTRKTNSEMIPWQYSSAHNSYSQFVPILKVKNQVDDLDLSRRSTKRVTMTHPHNTNLTSPSEELDSNIKIFDMLRGVTEADGTSDWNKLGVYDSTDNISLSKDKNNISFNVHIEGGVSQTNFNKCTCAELNIEIYEQLIYHAQQAEMKINALEFMLKHSYLSLLSNYNESIFPKLDEAERVCLENSELLNPKDKKRYLGRIYSLKAATSVMSGRVAAAKTEIEHALRIYRLNLYKESELLRIKNIINTFRIKRKKYRLQEKIIKSDSVFCLNVATLLYCLLGEDRLSRTAAILALELVQSVECTVVDMCDAYSNAIQVEFNRGAIDATADIEMMAMQSLKLLSRPIQADEIYALGKLFMSCFRARIARGQIAASTRAGFRALAISQCLHADNISLDIIPDLFYVLLSRRRIEEAVDIVQLSLRLSRNEMPHDGETWYYALCMDMILDAGFQLETPYAISRYAERALSKGRSAGPSRRRLIVGLWTYWLRADLLKKAKRFEAEALSWISNEDEDGSLTSLISALRLADGLLESFARKVDDLRKIVDLMELRSIADRELQKLENDARLMRALYPRWLLLRVTCLNISGRPASPNILNQALEEARRMNNRLEEAAVRAATSTDSVFWLQSARAGFFINWQAGAEHARTSWHQLLYKINTTK